MKELWRIYNVLNLFEERDECSVKDILEELSKYETDKNGNPKKLSYETWNRLRLTLGTEYGFDITYVKGSDSYTIHFGEKVNRDKLMGLINHFRTMNLLQTYIQEDKEMIDRLEFDKGMSSGKEEHINTLQHAMIESQAVMLIHQGYYKEETKEVMVHPLYFKQYQNRWYLIAEVTDGKEFRSYGMDRIKSVKYNGKTFKSRIVEAKKCFSEVIGVDLRGNGVQDVIIAFDPSQKPYLESLKLHHSQEVVSDTEEKYTVKIRVSPNYELQQQIQKFGKLAEVVEGDWLCL